MQTVSFVFFLFSKAEEFETKLKKAGYNVSSVHCPLYSTVFVHGNVGTCSMARVAYSTLMGRNVDQTRHDTGLTVRDVRAMKTRLQFQGVL